MSYNELSLRISEVVDGAGVVVLVVGAVLAAGNAAVRLGQHQPDGYRRFRRQLGRTILLGLELLVAGDIVRTVATEPSLRNLTALAILVSIRTFLSFSLEVELTGHWPWNAPPAGAAGLPGRSDGGPRRHEPVSEDARPVRPG